jgi:hypothetical protein
MISPAAAFELVRQHRSPLARSRAAIARGELTVGFLGGSITAPKTGTRWPERWTEWLGQRYPALRPVIENAALGATGSDLAVFRARGAHHDQPPRDPPMNVRARTVLLGCLILVCVHPTTQAAEVRPIGPDRIAARVSVLPDQPLVWGAPATDRIRWGRAAEFLPVAELVAAARQAAQVETPILTDELYLRYSRDGDRVAYQQANRHRLERLNLFAWAEAIEHRGEFVPAMAREIEAMLDERTWVLPAHDPHLHNWEGRWKEIDLMVAMKGWSLATIAGWHADQLSPALLLRLHAELRRRVIDPYLALVRGGIQTNGMWWLRADNNWNSVCNGGVLGTALAIVESRAERAEIVAQVEANSAFYLRGFTADGYCSEGMGYWNYGFGHFAMVSETLATATGGRIRLLAGDQAARVAAYPAGLQILPGVYPAFADMDVRERPSSWFGALAARQLHASPLAMKASNLTVHDLRTLLTYEAAMKVFLPFDTEGPPFADAARITGGHYWFKEAQVYTGRAAADFGVALKGGHNGEHHNHNDVGSFVIARGDRAVLVDPGLEVYTARTFGPRRYDSQVLNSYGHAVPVVAGRLQSTGRDHAARVVATSFTPEQDVVVLELAGAYDVPTLRSLRRTLTVRRGSKSEITMTDEVVFSEPQTFGTALITFEPWRERSPGHLVVGDGPAGLTIRVTSDSEWEVSPESLREQLPAGRIPTRLGLNLKTPVTTARISVTVTPR